MTKAALQSVAYQSVINASHEKKHQAGFSDINPTISLGRDNVIAVLKILNVYTKEPSLELLDLCKQDLMKLLSLQGTERNDANGEEPGKFIYQLLIDTTLNKHIQTIDSASYPGDHLRSYDSLDSTPLTLIALYTYWQITNDNEFLFSILPAVEKGLNWIITYGDKDKDMLLEYQLSENKDGRLTDLHFWTDSHKSLINDKGDMPKYPIAPVETQAFAWLALRIWADFYELHYPTFGSKILDHAHGLKQAFNESFLITDKGLLYAAQALDGDKKQISTITASPLLCLWASYANNGEIEAIVDKSVLNDWVTRAFLPDLFTENAGIRTMSNESPTYDQFSSHNGGFWPMLNGFVIEGLEKLGYWKEAKRLTDASLKPFERQFSSPVDFYTITDQGYTEYDEGNAMQPIAQKAYSAATMLDMVTIPRWARKAVVYQIYPRSFKDSNGDGIGDLRGIIEKLDYLAYLDIDAIWLSPIYPSPMADMGYDIADHCAIDPIFGTLEDFKELVNTAHSKNIKVMLDFVPNHTSDQHKWFQESRSSKNNPKRNWYIWQDSKEDGSVPNNWISVSGGSAWQFDETTNQYYLHSFLAEQPDLNWRNPEVVSAMCNVLRFWLDIGVDGFRVDVIYYLIKDNRFLDEPLNPNYHPGIDHPNEILKHIYSKDQPETLNIIKEFCDVIDEYPNKFMVSESFVDIPETVKLYMTSEKGLHAPFNFHLLYQPWTATAYKSIIDTFQASLRAQDLAVYVLGNHDQSRVATRVGGQTQARVAAMMQLTLPGLPFIYYGEEIGMIDVDIPAEKRSDKFETCRDFERTPMQWSNDLNAGFSTGEPWLPVDKNYADRNVEVEKHDRQSMFHLYRALIQLRKTKPSVTLGSYIPLDIKNDNVLAYIRKYGKDEITVLLNFSNILQIVKLSKIKKLIFNSYMDHGDILERFDGVITLRPLEGVILS